MLVETDNLVSADEFTKHLEKYVEVARQGTGPIAVTRDDQVLGFFISPEEYEAMFGVAVRKLLSSRLSETATVSHEQVRDSARESIRRGGKTS